MESDLLLVVVIVTALAFDFTNGFHDTANAMATSIATKALPPRTAVGLSAVLNFAGAFISIAVATTIAEDIVAQDLLTLEVLFAGLLGAIMWNLLTWALGLPSSSSHALIGGIVGAAWVAGGSDAVKGDGVLSEVVIPAIMAPLSTASPARSGSCSRSAGCWSPSTVATGTGRRVSRARRGWSSPESRGSSAWRCSCSASGR